MMRKVRKITDGLDISVALIVGGSLFMYPGLSALAGAEQPFESVLGLVSLFSFSCGSYMYWRTKKTLITHCTSLLEPPPASGS
jgi:hypothetical protein